MIDAKKQISSPFEADNSEIIALGTRIRAEFSSGNVYEGTVLGSDRATDCIVIQSSSPGMSSRDIHVLYTRRLQALTLVSNEGVQDVIPTFPSRQGAAVVDRNIANRRAQLAKIGVNVTPFAQSLFDSLNKTIDEVEWDQQDIVVMNRIRVSAPYTSESCFLEPSHVSNNSQETLAYVCKLVQRCNISRPTTAPAVNGY